MDAQENDCMVVVELDANAKIGNKIIKGDPHVSTPNGKLLVEMAQRQNLVIANSMDICEGTITRERVTKDNTETSVIDYILMSKDLAEYLNQVSIDDDRVFTLKITKRRQILSDHNLLFSKFNLLYDNLGRKIRREIFPYKNLYSQNKVKEETSIPGSLSESFSKTGIFDANAKGFFKNLKSKIQKCFKKIRIKTGNNKIQGNEGLQEN